MEDNSKDYLSWSWRQNGGVSSPPSAPVGSRSLVIWYLWQSRPLIGLTLKIGPPMTLFRPASKRPGVFLEDLEGWRIWLQMNSCDRAPTMDSAMENLHDITAIKSIVLILIYCVTSLAIKQAPLGLLELLPNRLRVLSCVPSVRCKSSGL